MRKIFLLILIFFSFISAKADVGLTSFVISSPYLSDSKLLVSNENISTAFKVEFSLMRDPLPTGGFVSGECYVTVLYTESPSYFEQASVNGDYESHPSTIELSSVKFVNASSYQSGGSSAVFYGSTDAVNATLPANKISGKILLRYRYYDRILKKELIKYSTKRYEIYAPNYISPAELSKLQSMGFSTIGIQNFNSTYYLVENDILIRKSSLNASNPVYIINNEKEHNVNIWVKPEVKANSTWNNAIRMAVAGWNANPGSDIKLHLVYQYGTLDVTPPSDIIIQSDLGVLNASQIKAVEFPTGDRKPGGVILANLDYNINSSIVMINNLIHAIGHTLGIKHGNTPISIMFNGNLSNYQVPFPSDVDKNIIDALYPLNVNSTVTPYISGIANIPYSSWSQDYDMSYVVLGSTYTWTSNTPHWLLPYEVTSQTRLPEMDFSTGTHELKCTTSHSKYVTPIIATKNIVVP